MKNYSLQKLVLASMMSALIAVGAFISFPIGPIPIALQSFFVLIAGLLLGRNWGLASVAIYLIAGAVGLPVFAGGKGGLGHLFGPSGGYLIGYLGAVFTIGWFSDEAKGKVLWEIIGLVLGSIVVYASGIPWLKLTLGCSWSKALAIGVYPFLIGDALKIAAAILVIRRLRVLINNQAGVMVAETGE
jgi:biotin transport system substrate-specific component